MNSVFVNPGIYSSCAVDAFLEISTHLFLPYLSNLRIGNEFTDLQLFNVCSHYMSSREDSSLLSEIREPVWSYIIKHLMTGPEGNSEFCFPCGQSLRVYYIDFLLNMSLSKINKSVVTIRKGQFMNLHLLTLVFISGNLYAFVSSIFIKSTYQE